MAKKQTDTRYGHNSGSGSNQPKHLEKKESPERGWVSRQGGDETRGDEYRQDLQHRLEAENR